MSLETLQYIYFSLGIIVMLLGLAILIALTIFVFYIKRKVDLFHRQVEERLDLLMNEYIRPAEAAIGVGTIVADTAISAARRFTRKKKNK